MRLGEERFVDLIEVDGLPVRAVGEPEDPEAAGHADASYFLAGPIGALLARWGWWRGADRHRRQLASACIGLAILATVAGVGALVQPDRFEARTTSATAPRAPAGVDAAGCPLSRTCELRPASTLGEVIVATLPQLELTRGSEVYDAVSGAVYRREVFARSTALSVTLWMTTQCLPNGTVSTGDAPVSRRFSTDPAGTEIVVVERTGVSAASRCTSFVRATYPRASEDQLGNLVAGVLQLAVSPEALTRV